MDSDARALDLIQHLYRAAAGENTWTWRDFAGELSNAYSGALVCLCLGRSRHPASHLFHSAGLTEDFGESLWRSLVDSMPWQSAHQDIFSEGFAPVSRVFPDRTLEDTDLYRTWMTPRGLPAVWPICLNIATNPLYADAAIVILRQPNATASVPFSQSELDFGNRLLPHFQHAFGLHMEMTLAEWNRNALREVIERWRLGVILLDSEGRLLKSNRSADRTLAAQAGLQLRDQRLWAPSADDDRKLQTAIARAAENGRNRRFHLEDALTFARKPGHLSLEFLVKPLLSSLPGSATSDAVTAIFIANPEEVSTFPAQIMRRLYSLTNAETELVELLVGGASLTQAAERRGVAINTARGQLKAIFSKTGTNKQSELVQLVLAGIMAQWDEYDALELTARQLNMKPPS